MVEQKNPWGDWESGACEICGDICINQFLEGFGYLGYLWRAIYWKKNVVCTRCVDDLTEEERDKLE